MAAILNIETATPLCSVALAIDGRVMARRETMEEKSHASRLTVFIEEILREHGLQIKDLNAIAVGKGPGSYTGLRIGVSTAKGLCYALKIPLISVPTLQSLSLAGESAINEMGTQLHPNDLLCPMIDARRMEVYCALYQSNQSIKQEVSAEIIDNKSFSNLLATQRIFFFGNGALKCQPNICSPNAIFVDKVQLSALNMASIAYSKFQNKEFENVAYFEPFYLKDFITTIPKKKLFEII